MRVWLVDFDGKMENLALMRLSTYHKQRGDSVVLKHGAHPPELWDVPDKVYVSCLFRWNRNRAIEYVNGWGGRAIAGGTGVDIYSTLPEEVSNCSPDYSLYGGNRAIGFISRGCIRKCPWCVVWRKEGELKRVSTAEEVVGNHSEAVFLDNNFLALSNHCGDLEWLAQHEIAVDFNQGLDARLVTSENVDLLAQCSWPSFLRIALDSLSQLSSVDMALTLLSDAGIPSSKVMVFCLIGFSGLESDVKRLLYLREKYVNVFPMGYRDLDTGEEPAKGWDRQLYKKYRRLICRLPRTRTVWEDFEREVT